MKTMCTTLSATGISSLAAFLMLFAAPSPAQTYPTKPLRFVVPALPGTSPDLLARTIGRHLSPRLGQPIVIVNQPGGGGNIGHGTAAKATADGYTLLVTSDQLSINESLFSKLPFHAVKSFAPVVQAIVSPQVLIVNNSLPFKDVAGLIEYARANPGKVNFGSPQVGTVGHLAGELFKRTRLRPSGTSSAARSRSCSSPCRPRSGIFNRGRFARWRYRPRSAPPRFPMYLRSTNSA
jgi:tripartite-type tricarboxylate transporter receptor subunit TctC